jgi:hypothetical protein
MRHRIVVTLGESGFSIESHQTLIERGYEAVTF